MGWPKWLLDGANKVANKIKVMHAKAEQAEPPKWLVDASDKAWALVPDAMKTQILNYITNMAKRYGPDLAKKIIKNIIKVLEEAIGQDVDGDGTVGN